MNLFVGNLSPETTEQHLKDAFSEFGNIVSVKIIIDPQTGFPKGFGFVEMEDKRSAYEAITNLDMTYLQGTIISVKEAKNNKQQGGGNRYGGDRSGQRRQGGGGNRQSGGYGDRRQSSDRPVYSRRPNYNSDGNNSFNKIDNFHSTNNFVNNNNDSLDF